MQDLQQGNPIYDLRRKMWFLYPLARDSLAQPRRRPEIMWDERIVHAKDEIQQYLRRSTFLPLYNAPSFINSAIMVSIYNGSAELLCNAKW